MSSTASDPASSLVSWVTLAVANGAGWLTSDFAGQVVTVASIVVFGAISLYTKIAQAIDARKIREATLPIRVRLEAERLERESKANAGTGEHVAL